MDRIRAKHRRRMKKLIFGSLACDQNLRGKKTLANLQLVSDA